MSPYLTLSLVVIVSLGICYWMDRVGEFEELENDSQVPMDHSYRPNLYL